MFDHILVPLDGSPASDAALQLAIALARHKKADLVCVHAVDTRFAVAQPIGFAIPQDPTPLIDTLKAQGEAILGDAVAKAKLAGLDARAQLVFDAPVAAIASAATACGPI